MRTLAILPVKSFGAAKQRLGDAVDDRAALARAMLSDVLDALARVDGLDGTIVVTANPLAAELEARGVAVVHDDREDGQSAAALLGIAAAGDAERVLLVPGDAPLLDPAEIDALLASDAPPVVIVPDRHGSGTNGLLLCPPSAIEPGFGPGSRERHEQRCREAGMAFAVEPLPSLVLDVDTPDDLRAAVGRIGADDRVAPATRAALAVRA